MFLTEEEVRELTGLVRPAAQVRWLKEHSYPFEVNAKGHPKVLKSVVEKRLGGKLSSEPQLRLAG
jgi:hypothetical protein